jgi:hypothetical protein
MSNLNNDQQAQEIASMINQSLFNPMVESVLPGGFPALQVKYPYSYTQVDLQGNVYNVEQISPDIALVDGVEKNTDDIIKFTLELIGLSFDSPLTDNLSQDQTNLLFKNSGNIEKALFEASGIENPFVEEYGSILGMLDASFKEIAKES